MALYLDDFGTWTTTTGKYYITSTAATTGFPNIYWTSSTLEKAEDEEFEDDGSEENVDGTV